MNPITVVPFYVDRLGSIEPIAQKGVMSSVLINVWVEIAPLELVPWTLTRATVGSGGRISWLSGCCGIKTDELMADKMTQV